MKASNNRMKTVDRREPSIFISHSSIDVVVARAVRNLLEDRNHNYVGLIGLASLEGKDKQEIKKLLTGEIKARDWLILIDSANARASEFVQFEIETAKSLGKPFYTIDCDRFKDQLIRHKVEHNIRPCVEWFSRRLRVYLSYSRKDREVANFIADWLSNKRFEPFTDEQISVGEAWHEVLKTRIEEIAQQGVFMILLSKASIESRQIELEIQCALSAGGLFFAVALEPVNLPFPISRFPCLDLTRYRSIADAMPTIYSELNRITHFRIEEHCGGKILYE